jgi:hypothetical protein
VTAERRCRSCGVALAGRSDRRYCSSRCRVSACRRRRDGERLPRGELLRLVEAVDVATAEVSLVTGIMRASQADWRAAAFILERHRDFRARWGPVDPRLVVRDDDDEDGLPP